MARQQGSPAAAFAVRPRVRPRRRTGPCGATPLDDRAPVGHPLVHPGPMKIRRASAHGINGPFVYTPLTPPGPTGPRQTYP